MDGRTFLYLCLTATMLLLAVYYTKWSGAHPRSGVGVALRNTYFAGTLASASLTVHHVWFSGSMSMALRIAQAFALITVVELLIYLVRRQRVRGSHGGAGEGESGVNPAPES